MRNGHIGTTIQWIQVALSAMLISNLGAQQEAPAAAVSGEGRALAFRQLPREETYGIWRQIGPVTYGGKVYDLAVDAHDADLVYAAYGAGGELSSPNGAGLWVTRDGGGTWKRSIDWLENSAFLSVRAHPKVKGYVAAGLRAVDYNNARGVMLSRDSGSSWQNIGAPAPDQHIWDIAFDPRDASTLYVASQSGVWRTADSGVSWQELLRYPPSGEFFDDAPSLAISPSGAVLLLAARGAGVQRSTDGGKTWVRVDGSWEAKETISVVAWAPGEERVVYGERVSGRVDKWGTTLDLLTYRSTDGGVSWQPGAVIPGRHQGRFDMTLAVDPRDAKVIYSGNDGGVWKSTDRGENWARIDTGVPTTHAFSLAATGDRVYVSPGDYSMLTFHLKSGWRDAGCGGEFERVYAAPDGAVYVLRRIYPGGRLYRMGSVTEPCLELGPKTKEKLASTMPVAFSPRDPAKIFVGLEHVWRSPDRGRTWRNIGPEAAKGRVLGITVSPPDDRSVVALSEDGQLWLTADAGGKWQRGAQAAGSRAAVFSHPEGKLLWVGGAKGLYRSNDGGLTIERTTGFPAGLAVQRLLIDPAHPKRLFAATDYGVVVSKDEGESWKRLDWGRPAGWVTEIALSNDVLYSTSSQGVWALPLGERRDCDWKPLVAPLSAIAVGARGGETGVDVYASQGCGWTAESGADWVRLQQTAHRVRIHVEPNREPSERTTKLTVAGVTVAVNQHGGDDPVYSGAVLQFMQGEECLAPGKKGRPHPLFQFGRCPSEPVFALRRQRELFYSLRLGQESRLCADAGIEVMAGRPVVAHPCHGLDHQLFQFIPASNGEHRIRGVTSGLCLTREGNGVVSQPCSEDLRQLFRLRQGK